MSALREKLSRLLALATVRENEAKDETRLNEARTAAFLLVKTCQEASVVITFKLPAEKVGPTWVEPSAAAAVDFQRVMEDLLRNMGDEISRQEARRREEERGWASPHTTVDPTHNPFRAPKVPEPRARKYAVADDVNVYINGRKVESVVGVDYAESTARVEKTVRTKGNVEECRRRFADAPIITSNFPGICMACEKAYSQGKLVKWVRGLGCVHATCVEGNT